MMISFTIRSPPMASDGDEFSYFLDNGDVVRVPRNRSRPYALGDEDGVGPAVLWYRLWQLIVMLAAIAAVILLGLILHCCLHHKKKIGGSGPLPSNESLSVILSPDQPPIPVTGTVAAFITDPVPISGIQDPVEVYGTVNTTLPLGSCSANESLCVSLAQDSGPIDVNVVNANCTINATIDPIIQAEIIGPFGGQCDANSSLCVSLAPSDDPLLVNGTVVAALDSPYGQCDVDEGLCVTVSGPLEVNATIVGPLGPECPANESLCVTLSPDTVVTLGNESLAVTLNETIAVMIINPVLPVTVESAVTIANDSLTVALEGVSVGGVCDANSSLCVSVTQDSPLQVEVINQQPIVVDNITLDVGPVTIANETLSVALDGVSVGGQCDANSSLCVSVAQDGPLQVEVINQQPIVVENLTLDIGAVAITNETLSVALDGVSVGGQCDANSSLCVSVAQDTPLQVEVINQQPIVVENLTLDIGAVAITNETLAVALDGVGVGGTCLGNESLCVSLAQDVPLEVSMVNPVVIDTTGGPVAVDLGNESVGVTLDGVGTSTAECSSNSSLCVSVYQEAPLEVIVTNAVGIDVQATTGPLPVVLVNATISVEPVTLANDTLSVALDGVDVGTCSGNASLCVSVSQDAPLQVEVINQQPIVVENLTLDIGAVAITNETLSVALDGVGVGGQCDANSSLCVSVAQDVPLQVEVINQQPIVVENLTLDIGAVAITNETLSVALDGVGVGGVCDANSSLCVSVAQDTPLQVEVINQQPIVLDNLTLDVGPVTIANETLSVALDGVNVGGQCDANSSLCVSVAQDVPLQVEVINQQPIVVENLTLDIGAVAITNETLSVALDGVGVGGLCDANASLCVSLAQDVPVQVVNAPGDVLAVTLDGGEVNATIVGPLGAATPQDQAVAVTLTNDAVVMTQPSSNSSDLFGRTRTSIPRGIFDFKSLGVVNEMLNFEDVQVSGSGTSATFSVDKASLSLDVSTNQIGIRVRQSLRHFNYQPGNTQVIYMTVNPSDTPLGVTKRWGYFQQDNGLFFEARGNNQLFAVVRSSTSGAPVDATVDVTGVLPPGFSFSELRLWSIEFVWMGATNVRFGFYQGSSLVVLFQSAIPQQFAWSSSPNLPLRLEITNDGTGSASGFFSSALSVRSEGASQPFAQSFSVDRMDSPLSITTDSQMHPLIGVRLLNPTYENAAALLSGISHVALDGKVIYRWALLYRAEITGEVPVWSSRIESPLESAAPGAAAICGGGQQFASGYVVGTAQTSGGLFDVPSQVYLGSQIDGTPLELWLCVERFDNGQGTDEITGGFTMLVSF